MPRPWRGAPASPENERGCTAIMHRAGSKTATPELSRELDRQMWRSPAALLRPSSESPPSMTPRLFCKRILGVPASSLTLAQDLTNSMLLFRLSAPFGAVRLIGPKHRH